MTAPRIAVIVTAAGSGTRLGSLGPKALVPLAGEPILIHALRRVAQSGIADDIVVTVPPEAHAEFRALIDAEAPGVITAEGGHTRQRSVANGIAAVPEADIILVHDAARCLTPPAVFQAVAAAVAAGHGAVIPALAVTDTIKEVAPAAADGTEPVRTTLARHDLRAVQTPQGFAADLLRNAHDAGAHRSDLESSAAPDDGALVEALGHEVVLVPGSPSALKITTALDLRIAELVLADAVADEEGRHE